MKDYPYQLDDLGRKLMDTTDLAKKETQPKTFELKVEAWITFDYSDWDPLYSRDEHVAATIDDITMYTRKALSDQGVVEDVDCTEYTEGH